MQSSQRMVLDRAKKLQEKTQRVLFPNVSSMLAPSVIVLFLAVKSQICDRPANSQVPVSESKVRLFSPQPIATGHGQGFPNPSFEARRHFGNLVAKIGPVSLVPLLWHFESRFHERWKAIPLRRNGITDHQVKSTTYHRVVGFV